jgi:dTMP kinase
MKKSLIVFDGIDGSGKTTYANLLRVVLERDGYSVILTKEPTDGKWGKIIKEIMFKSRELEGRGKELLELFINDRKEHVEKVIQPSLKDGKIVIVDRYYFSTIAYQGALGIDPGEIKKINESFAPIPDLVFLLDISPERALSRIKINRGDIPNLFEEKKYLIEVSRIFNNINEPYIIKIDAERPIHEIFGDILYVVDNNFSVI